MAESSPTSRFGAPITPTIDALIAKLDAAVLKSEYHKVTHEIAGFLQGHRDYIAELEQPAPSEKPPSVALGTTCEGMRNVPAECILPTAKSEIQLIAEAYAAPSSERATKRSPESIERIYQEAYEVAMRESQGEVNDSHKAAIMNVYEAGGREASALSASEPICPGWHRDETADYCQYCGGRHASAEGRDA